MFAEIIVCITRDTTLLQRPEVLYIFDMYMSYRWVSFW